MKRSELCPISSDVAFKAILGSHTSLSQQIRLRLIELLTARRQCSSNLLNAELTPQQVMGKTCILDVLVQDEEGALYDFEMQTSGSTRSEAKRFDVYEAQLTIRQIKEGDHYDVIQPTYQILFIDAYAPNSKALINSYRWRNEDGQCDASQRHRIMISLPAIDDIVKDGTGELSELEQVCYLFKNGYPYGILKTQGKLVRMIMEKYNDFLGDKSVWSEKMMYAIGERRGKLLAEELKQIKFDEGMQQGATKVLLEQIQIKYHVEAREWLSSLQEEQLNQVKRLILTTDSFEALKAIIER